MGWFVSLIPKISRQFLEIKCLLFEKFNFFHLKFREIFKHSYFELETLNLKKPTREVWKLNYLSYDTLFVMIELILFPEKILEVGVI